MRSDKVQLAIVARFWLILQAMQLPKEPVTLTVQEVDDLNRKLSEMRHAVNNNLCYIVAALEVMRKPEMADQMRSSLTEQTMKISDLLKRFSLEFEGKMKISHS
jgi:hypothetical protein